MNKYEDYCQSDKTIRIFVTLEKQYLVISLSDKFNKTFKR